MNRHNLIERIEAMRDGYVESIRLHLVECPQSAAIEEIKATRTANRLILELETEIKIDKHRNKNKK